MDADGLTFCAATTAEERAARKLGAETVRVGVRAVNGVPDGRLVSFGLAGALHDGVAIGDVLDARRVVDESGAVLWEGPGLGVGRDATILGSDALIHDPAERARLHAASGADAVDMESGVLARSGRLAGVLRVVSDDVASVIEGVDSTVHPDGRTNVVGLVKWAAAKRGDAVRSLRDAMTALRVLESVRRLDGARPGAEVPALPAPERESVRRLDGARPGAEVPALPAPERESVRRLDGARPGAEVPALPAPEREPVA